MEQNDAKDPDRVPVNPELFVALSDAMCAIESYDDVESVGLYIDRETGATFWLTEDLEVEPTESQPNEGRRGRASADFPEDFDAVTADQDRYLQFPTASNVNKVDRAEDFAQMRISDPKLQKKMLKLVKKSRDCGWTDNAEIYALICKAGLASDWNAYNDALNESFLRDWCESRSITLCNMLEGVSGDVHF